MTSLPWRFRFPQRQYYSLAFSMEGGGKTNLTGKIIPGPDYPSIVNREKKQLTQDYKQRPLTMGVFLIRNTVTNKIFLASGQNLAGIINRHKFDLRHGSHKNKQLQADWNELGSSNFAFEVVEQMEPPSDAHFDIKQELRFMEDLWLNELKPFGERGYNQPKLSRAEKLRRIARKGVR